MFNKRDSKLPPLGLNKRGNNHNNQKKETVPLQTVSSPEGHNTQTVQETTLLKDSEVEPLGRGVER